MEDQMSFDLSLSDDGVSLSPKVGSAVEVVGEEWGTEIIRQNDVHRGAFLPLNTKEKRLVDYILAQAQSSGDENGNIRIEVATLKKVAQFKGTTKSLHQELLSLSNKKFEVSSKYRDFSLTWLYKIDTKYDIGVMDICIAPELLTYHCVPAANEISKVGGYSGYPAIATRALGSRAVMLFFLLLDKRNIWIKGGIATIPIDELRATLDAESPGYNTYSQLARRKIKPYIEQINALGRIHISHVEPVRSATGRGRPIKAVNWFVKELPHKDWRRAIQRANTTRNSKDKLVVDTKLDSAIEEVERIEKLRNQILEIGGIGVQLDLPSTLDPKEQIWLQEQLDIWMEIKDLVEENNGVSPMGQFWACIKSSQSVTVKFSKQWNANKKRKELEKRKENLAKKKEEIPEEVKIRNLKLQRAEDYVAGLSKDEATELMNKVIEGSSFAPELLQQGLDKNSTIRDVFMEEVHDLIIDVEG